ncbi:MAG TPA: phosphoenolpyruvate--protein phosphotransferase [Caproicibacter sp.]|nr:phosphoenolpyruvate--protein phosphotransferase [Caproicibacter sp.]
MEEKIIKGIGVSEGIRIGRAFVFMHSQNVDIERKISEAEANQEEERFQRAADAAGTEIDELISDVAQKLDAGKIGVLKGQKGILADPAYCPEIKKLIHKNLLSSETAVKQVTEKFAKIFENLKNDYMKERSADIRDVGNRILKILSGKKAVDLKTIKEPVILIADDLSPTDTIQLNKEYILAFATQKGGKTSHTSIFAKSLGIPAAVGLPGLTDAVSDGDTVIIDGLEGLCILSPQKDTIDQYLEKQNAEAAEELLLRENMLNAAATSDGSRVIVAANIGSLADAGFSLEQGAKAVGLFRTEQLFLSRNTFPDEEEQFREYKSVAEKFSEKEVIIRTLDVGGDKSISYLNIPKEDNPFLGYRAVRLCLNQKELFLTQLRAILRASAFGKLSIMFPMISGYAELMAAKSVLDEAKSQLKSNKISYDESIRVGIMIEVPSAALMADVLAQEADFFSIGTNDLVQYTLAVDRGNEKVSYLYDYFNPAVIRLIKNIADAAHAAGIPVGMCGGMAGDPSAAPLLIGLNLDELSMAAGSVPKVKNAIRKVSKQECARLASECAQCKTPEEIHRIIRAFSANKT